MCFSVYVLTANNNSDFGKHDFTLVAQTEEALNTAFDEHLLKNWIDMDEDDIEFYKTYEYYADCWNTVTEQHVVYPLPNPGE